MLLLLLSATPYEIAPVVQWLSQNFTMEQTGVYSKGAFRVETLVSGVGMVATTWALAKRLHQSPAVSLVVNAGIAGAYDPSIQVGEVLFVGSEQFGDLGVEEADGQFTDLHRMGMMADYPEWCQSGVMQHPEMGMASFLPVCKGLTVNKVHGSKDSIEQIRALYPEVQIETMEGAAVFYACLSMGLPFMEIRSISNRVEPRNRANWDLAGSIKNLNGVLQEMIESF
ncbi:MAG: futalosine hydrolase [Bacteroidetes bacterium]|nr:futalosine hydrolase [Bacteroidota bacterium]